MTIDLLPAIEGGQPSPCSCCGPRKSSLCENNRIAVGFGFAGLLRDGEVLYQEDGEDWADCMSVRQAEELALADPEHDWRIVLYGPLRGATYQRHGVGQWVLVEKNQGFA